MPTPHSMSEYELHVRTAQFLNRSLPDDADWFHPPLGGLRSASEAKRLKAMGATAGLPDIGVIYQGRINWLELKARKGRLSVIQQYRHRRLINAGSPVATCRSLDEVEAALHAVGIPLRARIM